MLNEDDDYNDDGYKDVFGCYSKSFLNKIGPKIRLLTSAMTVKSINQSLTITMAPNDTKK